MYYIFWGCLIILIVTLDRWSKNKTIEILEQEGSIPILEDKLQLMIENPKAEKFSFFNRKLELIVKVTLLALLCAMIYLVKVMEYRGQICLKIALSFIIGGCFGNFIDRLGYGYVIDFICFKKAKKVTFNLSRLFVLIGSILLVFTI